MNITEGPMIRNFASIRDIPVKEVMIWVNSYVNHPELFDKTEETAAERANSIKKYITFRVENSLTARIKASILAQKENNVSTS